MKTPDQSSLTSKRARQQKSGVNFGAEPDRSRQGIKTFEKRPTRAVERHAQSRLFS